MLCSLGDLKLFYFTEQYKNRSKVYRRLFIKIVFLLSYIIKIGHFDKPVNLNKKLYYKAWSFHTVQIYIYINQTLQIYLPLWFSEEKNIHWIITKKWLISFSYNFDIKGPHHKYLKYLKFLQFLFLNKEFINLKNIM